MPNTHRCYIDIVEDVQYVGEDIVQTIARRWFPTFAAANAYVNALGENAIASRVIPASDQFDPARSAKQAISLLPHAAAARATIETEGYGFGIGPSFD